MKRLALLIIFSVVLAGCQVIEPIQQASDYIYGKAQLEQQKAADRTLAILKCQRLCQEAVFNDNQDFTVGECLSEQIIPDWVCDIAHSPRQTIDDDPANQCDSFRAGVARHFVEVDGNCNLIKAE